MTDHLQPSQDTVKAFLPKFEDRDSISSSHVVLAWLENTQDSQLIFLTDFAQQLLNIQAGQWLEGKQLWEKFICPEDGQTVLDHERWFKGKSTDIDFQLQLPNRDRIVARASKLALNRSQEQTVLGVIPVKQYSLLRAAPDLPAALAQNTARLTSNPAYDTLPGIVFERQLDEEWRMQYLSAGCFHITGYVPGTLQADLYPKFNDLIQEDDLIALQTVLKEAQDNHDSYSIEYRIQHRNGQEQWVLEKGICKFDGQSVLIGFEGLIVDITATKKAQEQLQYDAFYDQLTTLPNRSLFMDRLERLLKRTKRRPDYCFAVFFLDLDRFKLINDSLGHRAGDDLLIAVSQRLASCLRPGDTVARLGGDEFTMLVDDIQDTLDVTQISDRILEEMQKSFVLEGRDIYTSTSIGIALSSIGYNEADEMLRDADIALYQAKALGKARYAIFNPGMHIHAVARLQLDNDLQQALSNRELRLYYQPIVSLETGLVEGLEVFVYWQHPDRGLIGPNEFIPVAEENGTILDIGKWVLQQSIQQVNIWQKAFPSNPPLFISVNLSTTEILDTSTVQTVQSCLVETRLDPRCLKLEVSEKTFLEEPDKIVQSLNRLRALGVQICIDDFGTGYSALSYVNQFPVDIIKIDRSFISRLDVKENLEIVRTVLTLAENLSFQVVAEGVETVTQLAQLRALGCEWGQGYCLARPLEGKLVETCLLQEPTGELTSSVSVALPRLLVQTKSGQYHLLLTGRTSWTIGRGQESSIFLADRMVSREHAILLQLARTGDFFLVDLGSRNGSFLNENRIEMPVLLKQGDRIRIGKTELEYRDSTANSRKEWQEFPYKIVLMHQTYKLQGEIWREILISQGVSVIWHTNEEDFLDTLEQLEVSGDMLPDLLLLELDAITLDPAVLLQQIRDCYPNLKILLTSGRSTEIHPEKLRWATNHHASTLLPGFNLRGNDLASNSSDIAHIVQQLLDELECFPATEQLSEAAFVALQLVIRNETLY